VAQSLGTLAESPEHRTAGHAGRPSSPLTVALRDRPRNVHVELDDDFLRGGGIGQRVRESLAEAAMWFTPVINCLGNKQLSAQPAGANRNIAVARRMRKLFKAADLDYKSPHKFRHGHAVYGLQRARTMADYKAVSMNLMHSDIRVLGGIYARLATEGVRERITAMEVDTAVEQGALKDSAVADGLSDAELAQALVIAAGRLAR